MEAPERKEGSQHMRGDRKQRNSEKKNHRINKIQKQIRKI